MKNLIFTALFTLVLLSMNAQNDYDELRYLVVFDESTPQSVIDQIRIEHEAEEIWVSPYSQVRYWESSGYPHYVDNDLIGDVKEEVERLKSRPVVTGGGLDFEVISFTEIGGSGGPTQTQCFDNFRPTSKASTNSIVVSILDTGLSPYGIYPSKYTFSYGSYTGYNYIESVTDVNDENGHGTHIAGLISHVSQHLSQNGTTLSNINFDVRKVFNAQGVGSISNIIYGFDEAVLLGAKVINMSFAYNAERPVLKLEPLEYSITKAAEDQVLVVCAAGNEHLNNDTAPYPAFPASYTCDNILSVGSVNCISSLSDFSNFGRESVDVTFLGELMPGPSPSGDLVEKTGTSQATAVVSGIATAAASYLLTPDYRKVKCAILNTAKANQSLQGYVLSSGVANALEAATLQSLNSCNSGNSNHNTSFRSQKNLIEVNIDWKISPNPFVEDVVININSLIDDNYKIQIYSLAGELITSTDYECKIGANTIPLEDFRFLAKGAYFVRLSNDKVNEHKMVVRQ